MTSRDIRLSTPASDAPDFRALVERAADAVVLCDPTGTIFWTSPSVQRLLGRAPGELTGTSLLDLVHPDEMAKLSDLLFQVGQTPGGRLIAPARFRHANGTWHELEAVGVNLLSEPGVRSIALSLRDVIARQQAGDESRRSEESYRALIEQAVDGVFVSTPDGRFIEVNLAGCELLSLPRSDILAMNLRDLLPPEDSGARPVSVEGLRSGDSLSVERPLRMEDGRLLSVAIHSKRLSDGRIQTFLRDVSAERDALRALERQRREQQIIFDSVPAMIWFKDLNNQILRANRAAAAAMGRPDDALEGGSTWELYPNEAERYHADDLEVISTGLPKLGIIEPLTLASGEVRWVRTDKVPYRDDDGHVVGVVVFAQDITEARRAEAALKEEQEQAHTLARQLTYQASHDALTGLSNRRDFELRLEQALELARRDRDEHALCYIDLDQFKLVNDTCGHIAGDELLRHVGRLLAAHVRSGDTLARLGGDEFGVILNNCPPAKAREIAESLRRAVESFRFVWRARTFEVGASVGLVPVTAESGPLTELLAAADSACWVAKEAGRNRVHVYSADDELLARHHSEMQWAPRIRKALDDGRMVLYEQPIVNLRDRAKNGHHELLVRMVDESSQLIPPMAFIPAAERYHLMPAVDRWVIAKALSVLGADPPGTARTYSINLSGQSIGDEGLETFIRENLARHRVDPRRIGFEITETAAIGNLSRAIGLIRSLKEAGCTFALDDFGSGLSSFAYLKELPVDYLKIDGRFVKDMLQQPVDRAMVEAINSIGHVIGLVTVAEFVENQETLEALRAIGVDCGQGFHIREPRPLEA